MKDDLMKKLVKAGVLTPTPCHGDPPEKATVSNAYRLPDPLWEHGCDRCLFLGTFNNADLYVCPGDRSTTVIARYSSEPGDYASGAPVEVTAEMKPFPTHTHRELRVAWLIACDCGIANPDDAIREALPSWRTWNKE